MVGFWLENPTKRLLFEKYVKVRNTSSPDFSPPNTHVEDTPGYFVGNFQAYINILEMVKLQTIQETYAPIHSQIDSCHYIFGLQIISNILKESTIYLSKSSQLISFPLLSTNQRNPKN